MLDCMQHSNGDAPASLGIEEGTVRLLQGSGLQSRSSAGRDKAWGPSQRSSGGKALKRARERATKNNNIQHNTTEMYCTGDEPQHGEAISR